MKILLGADGSTFARIAEELLVRIPEWKKAEVVVASVAPSQNLTFASTGPLMPDGTTQVYETATEEAKGFADAAVSRLQEQGVAASAVYLEGNPGDELLEFAERNTMDAIAIGSRGMGAFQSLLLGSAARKLVAHAPCHVLIGRQTRELSPEETIEQLEAMPTLAVAVGVDGSDGAGVAVEFVKRQGYQAFEKLVAVCAEPLSVVPSGIDPASLTSLYEYDHERAKAVAARAAEELGSCCQDVKPDTGLGRPAAIIGQKAAEHAVDLILVGATRHGTIERFLIGSVSYELATEAPCSVLVIRPPKL